MLVHNSCSLLTFLWFQHSSSFEFNITLRVCPPDKSCRNWCRTWEQISAVWFHGAVASVAVSFPRTHVAILTCVYNSAFEASAQCLRYWVNNINCCNLSPGENGFHWWSFDVRRWRDLDFPCSFYCPIVTLPTRIIVIPTALLSYLQWVSHLPRVSQCTQRLLVRS